MNTEELRYKLVKLDEDAMVLIGIPKKKLPVVIIGGAAFLINELTHRSTTHDIEVLEAHRSLIGVLKRDRDLNFQCNAYVNCIPYNFEDRLCNIPLETQVISYFTPSPEDLAVLKLYRWESRDIEDLTNKEFLSRVDWELLDKLVTDPCEALASRISEPKEDREFQALLRHYEIYRGGYK